MLEAAGAPFVQGHAQGRAFADGIAQTARGLRRQYGVATWYWTLSEVHLGSGRRMLRHTPQLHERLEGIAAGAEVDVRALELFDAQSRVAGVASSDGRALEARLEVPAELELLLFVRHSRPDAGGFASVELTCAPWTGCLAGVNENGLAALVVDDRAPGAPSVRVLAQDVIYRRDALEPALDHLRKRAAYSGATGRLCLQDGAGRAVEATLQDGALSVSELRRRTTPVAESTVTLESGSLGWRGERFAVPG